MTDRACPQCRANGGDREYLDIRKGGDMEEVWKDVKGYAGLYQISNKGRVKSLGRVVLRGVNSNRTHAERILAVRKDGRGYHQVRLYKRGVSTYPKVHRLVGTHFLQNKGNLPQINHKDEDKDNNAVDNLEWCTSQYNAAYSNAKTYFFVSPKQLKTKIHNLNKFCRENNLTCANMSKVNKGTRSHHKGWTKWVE